MKAMAIFLLLFSSVSALAHKENAGCKKIHEACSEANQTGKDAWHCAHNLMKGEKVEGINKDLIEAIKDCKSAKGLHHQKETAADSAAAHDSKSESK